MTLFCQPDYVSPFTPHEVTFLAANGENAYCRRPGDETIRCYDFALLHPTREGAVRLARDYWRGEAEKFPGEPWPRNGRNNQDVFEDLDKALARMTKERT